MGAIVLLFQLFCGVSVAKEIPADWVYNLIGNNNAAKVLWFVIKAIAFFLGFACGQLVLILCAIMLVYFMITKK